MRRVPTLDNFYEEKVLEGSFLNSLAERWA